MLTVDDYGAIRRAHRDGMSIRRIAATLVTRGTRSARSSGNAEPSPCPDPEPVRAGLGAVSGRSSTRSWPTTRRPAQAAAHRHAGVSPPPRRTRLPRLLRPGATLSPQAPPPRTVRPSSLWAISQANASKPISVTSTSTSPTAGGWCPSSSPPGPTPTPPSSSRCPPSAPRRSSTAWSPPSSSSARSQGSLVGQPQDRGHVDPPGPERQLHPQYAALASHYVFDPRFCMPAHGNEKPDAESDRQGRARRFATPVPRVADLDELNAFFASAARPSGADRAVALRTVPDRGPFAEELAAARRCPSSRSTPA